MTVVGGERAAALTEPHHDGSELYVVDRPDEVGGTATVRLRAPHGAAEQVLAALRHGRRAAQSAEAVVDEESDGETWWRAELPVAERRRCAIAGSSTAAPSAIAG